MTMKKPKVPPLDTPGTFCPNCGQTRTSPKDGDPKYPNMYPATEPNPHTDPFDCFIRHTIFGSKPAVGEA